MKLAALLAFVGTLLATILTTWRLVINIFNALNGAVAPAVVLSSLIEALAWLSLAVFFFLFHRSQARG